MILYDIFHSFYFVAHITIFLFVVLDLLLTQREDAKSTTMWILTVLLLPILGVILYLLFGYKAKWPIEHRVTKALSRLKKLKIKQHQIRPLSDRDEEKMYNKMLNNLGHREYRRSNNTIKLLHDGTQTYPEMEKYIRSAQHHIHLQSYIIRDDEFTRRFFDLLVERANAGVKVRVLYDGLGSFKAIFSGFFAHFASRSPRMIVRPFSRWMIFTPWRLQHRNHRKILIVDGKVAFAGGINLFKENIGKKSLKIQPQINDIHAKMMGPIIYDIQFQFFRDWFFAGDETVDELEEKNYFPFLESEGNSIIRLIGSGPGQHDHGIENLFNTMLSCARSHIWIMTPYFIPNISFIQAIRMARLRGIEVRIILPEKTDMFITTNATRVIYAPLIKRGVRIFEKRGNFTHSKAILVDNDVVVMGSPNCDVRSFSLNYESAFVVECPVFNNQLRHHFRSEMKKSREITELVLENKHWYQKILETICYLFSPIL